MELQMAQQSAIPSECLSAYELAKQSAYLLVQPMVLKMAEDRYFVPTIMIISVLVVKGVVGADTVSSILLILILCIYLVQAVMIQATTVAVFAKPVALIPWCLVIEVFVLAT